jgi:dihydroorotase-like cyclic amidohydrolase
MIRETFFLPSTIIDSHVHGRDMNQCHKTTVAQVLREAKGSLIGTSIFMPNTDPPIISLDVLERYLEIIESARRDLGLPGKQYVYFGVSDDNLPDCHQALQHPDVIGLKVYPKSKSGASVTTGTIGVAEDVVLLNTLNLSERHNKAVAFHCDDPEIIALEGNTIWAESAYVEKILMMARDFPEARIVICHVSSIESAKLILEAQRKGVWVAMELCPHYLWFDSDGTNWNPELDPVFYHCYNNLRSKENREFLVSLLAEDNPYIFIGSDNAPHTEEEKIGKKMGGLPSNQEMVPVILTLAKRFGISNQRVIGLLLLNASHFLKIPDAGKMIEYRLERRVDSLKYNDGKVVNPWNGSELLFPVPVA